MLGGASLGQKHRRAQFTITVAAIPDICPHSLLMRARRTAHRHFGRLPRSAIVERVAHVDRTQEMTLFAARAEQASVAAVARRLGISTATVTRTIAQLASRLGARLVVRHTRTMRLPTRGGRMRATAGVCWPNWTMSNAVPPVCTGPPAAC
ncbi:helix-turn-helix domain-containing protein [Xanthomonas oryzae]|uniref:helix-turn-helix domain-containing protein n=1 Tax=Xanthomonas oryzae TaxID=347 RepID=UPI003CE5A79B